MVKTGVNMETRDAKVAARAGRYVKKVQTITKTEFPAANQLVQRLVEFGVLKEITGQARNRQFRFVEYVRLFEDKTGKPHVEGK
ncbi:MAG: hypothetical protein KatS3mg082_2688 [Nitrospiraceae bacterium]|nr:MAG: hypothetical protein KatS3mg082_2688 [Nitrospiraceae bacterium]